MGKVKIEWRQSMENLSRKYHNKQKNIFRNQYFRRISVIFLVTIMVLTISHVYNLKYLEAKAESIHEQETRSKDI